MNVFTVKKLVLHMVKSEETIKRWLRLGRFSDTYLISDKEGWRIPMHNFIGVAIPNALIQMIRTENYGKSLIKLAYEAVTFS